MSEKKRSDEKDVCSVCIDHNLTVDEGIEFIRNAIRRRFYETKKATYERERAEDGDFRQPITVIIDVSVAPDYLVRSE